jgi:hypothetical protein
MSGTTIGFYYQNSGSHSLVLLQQLAVRLTRSRCMQEATSELHLMHVCGL